MPKEFAPAILSAEAPEPQVETFEPTRIDILRLAGRAFTHVDMVPPEARYSGVVAVHSAATSADANL